MYAVAVSREFVAQHYLVGGDWGAENQLHSHPYRVEVELQGATLDQHGYLVDIVDIEQRLDQLVDRYRDRTLNELDEFSELNPSIEHFSRIFCEAFAEGIAATTLTRIVTRIWETNIAWASYQLELR